MIIAGYAVTSGYYFDRNQSLYACADPGWNYVGQVYKPLPFFHARELDMICITAMKYLIINRSP